MSDFDWIGTLVILVVEIRFSTQQEVIWDFLLLLMSWLQWQQWHHWPTVTAVMCSACSFLPTQGEKRREWPCRRAGVAAASPQTYFTAKQALLIIYDWIVGMWTLCVMFSQLIRVSVAALILSRCFLTDGTEILLYYSVRPYPSPADINIKIKHNSCRLFFRNIFYRWCQRWNVQSVGPKESFFLSIETNNKQKKNIVVFFFKSIYM